MRDHDSGGHGQHRAGAAPAQLVQRYAARWSIELRRTMITGRISGSFAAYPEPAQIRAVLAAWHAAVA